MTDLAQLRALLEAASAEFVLSVVPDAEGTYSVYRGKRGSGSFENLASYLTEAQAELLVAAVNSLGSLLDELERLRGERDEMAHVNSSLIEMTDWLRRNFTAVGEQWDERWRRRHLDSKEPG